MSASVKPRPPSTAPDPAPAPPAPLPPAWPLAALTRPAWATWSGRAIPVGQRLWLEWAADRLAKALARLCDRPVSVVLLGDAPAAPAPVYGVEIGKARGSSVLLGLDAPAARAIVDAIAADAAGLRGTGAPTEAETGVLDFASLACADEVVRAGGSALAGVAIRSLPGEGDEGWWPADGPEPALFRLTVGSRAGLCLVRADPPLPLSPPPPPPATGAVPGRVEIGFALPAVAVSAPEWRSVAPGDTLLLGASAAERESLRGRLMTVTGWELAPARVQRDTPTLVSVRCGPPDIRPGPGPDDDSGNALLVALVGGADAALSEIAALRDAQAFDLPKLADAPVRLLRAGVPVARGELVAVEGEIGVRILRLGSPAGGAA